MQDWIRDLNDDPLPWLLEEDAQNPGVRYFALGDLLDKPPDDPEVVEAREAVMSTGPVPTILQAQEPVGYWVEPGPGYRPKYRSIVWWVIMLAQLGANGPEFSRHAPCAVTPNLTRNETKTKQTSRGHSIAWSASCACWAAPPSSKTIWQLWLLPSLDLVIQR